MRGMTRGCFVWFMSTVDAGAVEGACGVGGRQTVAIGWGRIALGLSSRVMMMMMTDGGCVL